MTKPKPLSAPTILRPTNTVDLKCNYCGKGPLVDKGFDPRWNSTFYQCTSCKGGIRVRVPEAPVRDPEDPTRYLTGTAAVDDIQRALVEQWAFNHRQSFGTKMPVPVALYDVLKAAGVDTKDMTPQMPLIF
jgi:hypothetical protein